MTFSESVKTIPVSSLPLSSTKLLPAPTPIVNAWGTHTLLSDSQASSSVATPLKPSSSNLKAALAVSSNKSITMRDINLNGNSGNFQSADDDDGSWPTATSKTFQRTAVSPSDKRNGNSISKENKRVSKEKWVHYDATIMISSNQGTDKNIVSQNDKTRTNSNKNLDDHRNSDNKNNMKSNSTVENGKSKARMKKSKNNRSKNKDNRETKYFEKSSKDSKEGSNIERKPEIPKKHKNNLTSSIGINEKHKDKQKNNARKTASPKHGNTLIQSAKSVESNTYENIFDDFQIPGSYSLNSAATEATQATTEDGDITVSQANEEGPKLPGFIPLRSLGHYNQINQTPYSQYTPNQFTGSLKFVSIPPNGFSNNIQPPLFHPNGSNGDLLTSQLLPQQLHYNINQNGITRKNKNSESLGGNRSVSGGPINTRYNNGKQDNQRFYNSSSKFKQNKKNGLQYPHIHYGYHPIFNQQIPYGQISMGYLPPQAPPQVQPQFLQQASPHGPLQCPPHSKSSSQSPNKDSVVLIPFPSTPDHKVLPQQPQFIHAFNSGMAFGTPPMYPQPFINDTLTQVILQVQYYFSIDNLIKDTFMRKQMNSMGFIPIDKIMQFRRMQILAGGNHQLVFDALMALPQLEVRGDKVRLRDNYQKWLLPYEQRDSTGKVEETEIANTDLMKTTSIENVN